LASTALDCKQLHVLFLHLTIRLELLSQPTPPSSCGKYVVNNLFPQFVQCDFPWWLPSAHSVVMATLTCSEQLAYDSFSLFSSSSFADEFNGLLMSQKNQGKPREQISRHQDNYNKQFKEL